jgi:hypothetical protein
MAKELQIFLSGFRCQPARVQIFLIAEPCANEISCTTKCSRFEFFAKQRCETLMWMPCTDGRITDRKCASRVAEQMMRKRPQKEAPVLLPGPSQSHALAGGLT